jgi:hypothetical protein
VARPGKTPASWQAQVAFYLALVTAAFSGFQWWTAQQETAITTAIDMSKRYFDDKDLPIAYRIVRNWRSSGSFGDDAESQVFHKFMLYIEYVSYLANRNRINIDYISNDLRCAVNTAYDAMVTAELAGRPGLSMARPETKKLGAKLQVKDCLL